VPNPGVLAIDAPEELLWIDEEQDPDFLKGRLKAVLFAIEAKPAEPPLWECWVQLCELPDCAQLPRLRIAHWSPSFVELEPPLEGNGSQLTWKVTREI